MFYKLAVLGQIVTRVNVVVSGPKGDKVVGTFVRGPIFMAKLPAGEYSVAATCEGKAVTRKVAAANGRLARNTSAGRPGPRIRRSHAGPRGRDE